MTDAIDSYELVHKNLRLVKVDSDNCFDLADLSIKEDQIDFVAPNLESMALAFGTLNEGSPSDLCRTANCQRVKRIMKSCLC